MLDLGWTPALGRYKVMLLAREQKAFEKFSCAHATLRSDLKCREVELAAADQDVAECGSECEERVARKCSISVS